MRREVNRSKSSNTHSSRKVGETYATVATATAAAAATTTNNTTTTTTTIIITAVETPTTTTAAAAAAAVLGGASVEATIAATKNKQTKKNAVEKSHFMVFILMGDRTLPHLFWWSLLQTSPV